MEYFPAPLEKLVEQFAKLPGVGYKSAQRLAFHVLSLPTEEAQTFADAITDAKRSVTLCPVCQNLTPEVCVPSAPTPSGTTPPSAWWQTPGTSSPLSAAGSTGGATTSSTACCPP